MKAKEIFIMMLLGHFATMVYGQGTVVFDQQTTPPGATLEGSYDIQSSQPIGQSFIPSLNTVGFVQLAFAVDTPGNAPTLYVNLLANSITGLVIAQTAPVTLPATFEGTENFYFATPATVSPGTTYYIQPVVQTGSAFVSVSRLYSYSGGTSFIGGTADPSQNLYFREGILGVPEPSTWALLLLGGGALFFSRRKVG